MNFYKPYKKLEPYILWSDQLKPKKLADIVGQSSIIEILQSYLDQSVCFPNLMLIGAGNNQIAETLVKQYLSSWASAYAFDEIEHAYHLIIDGAIERGKDTLSIHNGSNKVTHFIKSNISLGTGSSPLKIITIYDFDCMTDEAQMILRKLMETYAHRVRFILLVEQTTNIIEAIQSRTLLLSLTKVSTSCLKEQLARQVPNLDDSLYQLITLLADHQLDQGYNYFHALFGLPSYSLLEQMITHCLAKQWAPASKILSQLLAQDYDPLELIETIIKVVKYSTQFTRAQQTYVLQHIVQFIQDISIDYLSELQLFYLLLKMTHNSP
jgi:hypothetical protein